MKRKQSEFFYYPETKRPKPSPSDSKSDVSTQESFIIDEQSSFVESEPNESSPESPVISGNTQESPTERLSASEKFNLKVKSEIEEVNKISKRKFDEEKMVVYQTFNELKQVCERFNLSMGTPEIAVVGMQSDGKSSFVESLLGFRFNTIQTELGTRRPLIIQMINDQSKNLPECKFCNDEFRVIDKVLQTNQIEREIKRRTNEVCGPMQVSSLPIMMVVRFKYCANLTLMDFPGFRKAPEDPIGKHIEEMVLSILRETKNMLIVCLEQSTVEWCNTQVRPIVQKVDSNFSRTVFVCSKFNNRINQFRDGEEVNKYMTSGLNQMQGKNKIFFLSLPSGVELNYAHSVEQFGKLKHETYMKDYKTLVKLGFDEKNMKKFLGVYRLEQYLEKELYKRYLMCIRPVRNCLFGKINVLKTSITALNNSLLSIEKEDVRKVVSKKIGIYCRNLQDCLSGSSDFHYMKKGLTLVEEFSKQKDLLMGRKNVSSLWPNVKIDLNQVANSKYKLYGGAMVNRLVKEFELVLVSMEFPKTCDDEVVVALGLNRFGYGLGLGNLERAARDLTSKKFKQLVEPVLETFCKRSGFIMDYNLDIISEHRKIQNDNKKLVDVINGKGKDFCSEVKKVLREALLKELKCFTEIIDWEMFGGEEKKKKKKLEKDRKEEDDDDEEDIAEFDYLNPTVEMTIKRVQKKLDEKKKNIFFFI